MKSRSGRGATINIVIPSAGGAPAGGLGAAPMASAGLPSRPLPPSPVGLARPPMMPPAAPTPTPAMNRGGRVMAGSGSGLGRLQKSGR